MNILGPTTLCDVLGEWGSHEARGRAYAQLQPNVRQGLSGPDSQFWSLYFILQFRAPLIARILAALPENYMRIEVTPEDHSLLRILGNPSTPLDRIAPSSNISAQDVGYINRLSASGNQVSGPFLALARSDKGPFTLFDGVHRVIAWHRHSKEGRNYPVSLNVIVTRNPVCNWE